MVIQFFRRVFAEPEAELSYRERFDALYDPAFDGLDPEIAAGARRDISPERLREIVKFLEFRARSW